MFEQLREGLLDFIFPRNCLCCRRHAPDPKFPPVCDSCLKTVEFNGPPFCLRCSRRLQNLSAEGICDTCQRHEMAFDCAWAAVAFNNTTRHLIHAFKYQHKTALRKIFAHLILDFLNQYKITLEHYDCLMPIPLHPARLRERGFNQAQLLAQQLQKEIKIPLQTHGLVRAHPTLTQTQLSSKERFTNLKGAFRIKHPEDIKGKNILLIDDLLTTGATASEAASVLKQHGAGRVGVVTVAITQ